MEIKEIQEKLEESSFELVSIARMYRKKNEEKIYMSLMLVVELPKTAHSLYIYTYTWKNQAKAQ